MPANNPHLPVGSPTILMMTYPLRHLPLAHHHATVCSAGSKGYCAVKEMLQSGVPGHTLLVESGDLRDVESSSKDCCLIYSCSEVHIKYQFGDHVPTTVDHLTLYSNSVRLPPNLLADVGITSIDLSPLSQVTEIQWAFLQGCTSLTTLDLNPLSKVTVVHGYFLQGCSGLRTLDLSPLSQVTEVHGYFLQGCSGLSTLDLSPLWQVMVIQESFLQGCSGLTALDLSPLSRVAEVHNLFLDGCTGLTGLDLSVLLQVTWVHGFFLKGCNNLDAVNSPPMCPPPSGWGLTVCTTGARKWVRQSQPIFCLHGT